MVRLPNMGEDDATVSAYRCCAFNGGKLMRILPTIMTISVLAMSAIPSTTVMAQTKQAAKAGSWDGTWSGTSSAGGRTTVKIASGKVTMWTNNGFPRPKAVGTARGNSVSLDDNNGWKATMTMQGDGKARITASGIGNNGKPAKNTAVLRKQ